MTVTGVCIAFVWPGGEVDHVMPPSAAVWVYLSAAFQSDAKAQALEYKAKGNAALSAKNYDEAIEAYTKVRRHSRSVG